MVKSGDFKTSKSGVVNTNVKKEGEKPDDPRKDHDVEDIKDFIREDSFKVSAINNAPDEDDPFGFSGVGFGKFQLGVELADVHVVSPPKKPKSIGIEFADVKSGRGGQLTLEWWK